jgi:hypothetical protein
VELYIDDTEITAYKLLVAKAVGEMGFALLFPIYKHYPQLKPGPEARPNPTGGEILTVDVNKDPSKLAEIVMNIRERVRAELVSLLKMVQEGIDPQEESEVTERFQAVLDCVADVRLGS